MLHRFSAFVGGITECYKYIQRIKAAEMTEFGLKGTHVMCLFYLAQNPEGLTAAQLCALCQEDKAAISRTLSELAEKGFLLPQSKSTGHCCSSVLQASRWPGSWTRSSPSG